MSKITMPFFQATSPKLPLDKEVVNVNDIKTIPSAGPYAYSRNDVNTLTSLRQNPFWKAGPGRTRPRNLTGLDLQWNLNEQTAFNQVKNNELDEGPLPAAEVQGVAGQYGVNKTRFWTKAVNCTGYLPMNTANDLFKNNTKLRQAVSYVLTRKAYTNQAGPYAGQAWSHLFNPGVPGWRSVNPYPLKPAVAKAKSARRRSLQGREDHRVLPLVRHDQPGPGTDRPPGPDQSRLLRREHHDEALLRREHLRRHGLRATTPTWASRWAGARTTRIRTTGSTSCSTGPSIKDENNVNYSYFNNPKWNKRMANAAKLPDLSA